MNTTVRLSTMIGAGLLTAAVSAGPAQAATQSDHHPHRDRATTVGYFAKRSDCMWIGRTGESQDRWENPVCDQPDDNPMQDQDSMQDLWRLQVDSYDNNGPDQNWPGQGWPGQGWPGQGWPGQNGGDDNGGGGGHGHHHGHGHGHGGNGPTG